MFEMWAEATWWSVIALSWAAITGPEGSTGLFSSVTAVPTTTPLLKSVRCPNSKSPWSRLITPQESFPGLKKLPAASGYFTF
ncbi:hypothetical protein SKAU_G00058770 [Synaphobranchus kaupii]|uniref:Secreted protein n=1 Tax=Synaphobranchus kaupii TaxID=118154 RepID=A0A9Q1G5H8_SYNKA|nr:hypothetical protein SKAU_G00058770 [Synaphobranchus kaupii]